MQIGPTLDYLEHQGMDAETPAYESVVQICGPKVCEIMACWAMFEGSGLLLYIPLESRYCFRGSAHDIPRDSWWGWQTTNMYR